MLKNSFFILFSLVILFCANIVLDSQNSVRVFCGDIIESEFTRNQSYSYLIDLSAGDTVLVSATSISDTQNLQLSFVHPAGRVLYESEESELITGSLSSSGEYSIIARSRDSGIYILSIACGLRDGTIVEPGSNPSPINTPSPNVDFSGFRGIAPVDFSTGIELPLSLGVTQVVPIGGGLIALYSFQAVERQTAELHISRLSGNISIGIAVINKTNNQLLFMGGMPSSDNLSVELIFPDDAVYLIGLFQLDDEYDNNTSGAVQILLE